MPPNHGDPCAPVETVPGLPCPRAGLSALWVTLLVWLGCGLTEAVVVSHFLASPTWWRLLSLWIAQDIGRVRAAASLLSGCTFPVSLPLNPPLLGDLQPQGGRPPAEPSRVAGRAQWWWHCIPKPRCCWCCTSAPFLLRCDLAPWESQQALPPMGTVSHFSMGIYI